MEVTEQRDVNKKETSGRKIVAMEVVSNWSRHVNEINYKILDSSGLTGNVKFFDRNKYNNSKIVGHNNGR